MSFRRILIVAIALLFSASGVAARYCVAAHFSSGHALSVQVVVLPAQTDGAHHAHMHDHSGSAQHDHGGSHQEQMPSEQSDVGCAKCCGFCTVATALLPAVTMQPAFAFAAAEFTAQSDSHSGTTIRVDPGIPKRTA